MPGLNPHDIAEKTETRLTLTDLQSGGLLNDLQLKRLKSLIQQEAKLPGDNHVEIIDQKKMKWDYGDFPTRMTFPVDEHEALDESKYTKMVTDKVEFDCQKYVGAIPLSSEVLQNNLNKGTLGSYCMKRAGKRIALDIEEYGLLNDTGHADADFQKFDGLIAQPTSHILDPLSAHAVDYELWYHLQLALPNKYWRDLDEMRFYCSHTTEAAMAYYLGTKSLGEAYRDIEKDRGFRLRFEGVPIFPVPSFPNGYAILTHRKNIVWALNRVVSWDIEKEPKKDRYLYHVRYSFDVKYAVEDAVVIHKNIAIPTAPTS